MTFGARFKNNAGEILVDSDFYHYHFMGKANYASTTRVPDIFGGNNTQHSTTSGQYMAPTQINGDIIKYNIATSGTAVPPMCFIKPSSTGSSAPSCSVILIKANSGNSTWDIWVLQRRTGTYNSPVGYTRPDIYCFSPLNVMTSSQSSIPSSENLGVVTYNASNAKTYDSRLQPLKVIHTVPVTAPTAARTGAIHTSSWNPNFSVDQQNTYTLNLTNKSDLMYYAPSLAHACQELNTLLDGDGYQSQGYSSFFYAWARADLWYCFYRNTFRIESSTFKSTYDIYASGHIWESTQDNSSLLAAIAAIVLGTLTLGATAGFIGGFLVANDFNLAGIDSGSYYPYSDSSRNTGETVNVLFSRPSYYD